jgi:hypothetical protein
MDERREKGLCFNCDKKYNKGHKFQEKKLFYVDHEEDEDQELEPSQDLDLEETTPTIYCHALANINITKTIKKQGCKKKVTLLIDSCSTHNDAGESSVSTCGRTTQCSGIISESEMLGVTANLLELIGKMEEDQTLGR